MAPSRNTDRVRRAAANASSYHLRLMASLTILAGVFMLGPAQPQQLGAQVITLVSGMNIVKTDELPYRAWGAQALDEIESGLRSSATNGYIEEANGATPDAPAFLWSRVVHLSALAAAAQAEPDTFIPRLRRDVASLRSYWVNDKGLGGFDVLPGPKPVDRYYDDNAWMVLALIDSYNVTGDAAFLDWAKQTFRFVMSGEDEKLGGGIYWREQVKETKNACSNAPAALAALRLYRETGDRSYLGTARRLYDWMNTHLRDADALYSDHIRLGGGVDHFKWSYNSALMIQVDLGLSQVTGEQAFLDEALATGRAARTRWIKPSGAIDDDAAFAQHLLDAFLKLADVSGDASWRDVSTRAVQFLHDRGMDTNARYGKKWSSEVKEALPGFRLIDQAAAARAYWLVANAGQMKK